MESTSASAALTLLITTGVGQMLDQAEFTTAGIAIWRWSIYSCAHRIPAVGDAVVGQYWCHAYTASPLLAVNVLFLFNVDLFFWMIGLWQSSTWVQLPQHFAPSDPVLPSLELDCNLTEFQVQTHVQSRVNPERSWTEQQISVLYDPSLANDHCISRPFDRVTAVSFAWTLVTAEVSTNHAPVKHANSWWLNAAHRSLLDFPSSTDRDGIPDTPLTEWRAA